jgi:hypothetical protein
VETVVGRLAKMATQKFNYPPPVALCARTVLIKWAETFPQARFRSLFYFYIVSIHRAGALTSWKCVPTVQRVCGCRQNPQEQHVSPSGCPKA